MRRSLLASAAMGDYYGAPFEFHPNKNLQHIEVVINSGGAPRSEFTDDSIMTFAIAKWLTGGSHNRYRLISILKDFVRRYPSSYGTHFGSWALSAETKPYNSCGNGSAMRVSPIGWWAQSLDECLELAKQSAEVTHNHPEGIKGAQAIAAVIYLQRAGWPVEDICDYIEKTFQYNLNRTYESIRAYYKWDGTCQGCVPEAIVIWRDEPDYGKAIAKAIALGGDADTLACIVGSMYICEPDDEAEDARIFPDKFSDIFWNLVYSNPEFCSICIDFDKEVRRRGLYVDENGF